MAEILRRRTPLEVVQAAEGDRIRLGTVHIAPPDRHLLVNRDGSLSLSHSELVHFVRPSADLLFESVAASYEERAIAVVLTGTGSDGSLGIGAIKKMGGTVIAQDQESAEFFGMPAAAINSSRSASGAQASPPAKRPTASPCCSAKRSASRSTGSERRFMPPTSTTTR